MRITDQLIAEHHELVHRQQSSHLHEDPVRPGEADAVVIGQGITRIGSYAFSGCGQMTAVSLPGSLKEIGKSALDVFKAANEVLKETGRVRNAFCLPLRRKSWCLRLDRIANAAIAIFPMAIRRRASVHSSARSALIAWTRGSAVAARVPGAGTGATGP